MNNMRDQIIRRSGTQPRKCMRCGKCSAVCPAYDEMEFHPHQFVSMIEDGDIDVLLNSKSIYKCLTCFACVDRCPRNVQPARLIEAIRLTVTGSINGEHLDIDDIPNSIDEDLPQQALVSAFRKYLN